MKKIVVSLTLVGTLLFFWLIFLGYDSAAINFQMFPVLLLISLIFSFTKKENFDFWIKFSTIYLLTSIFLVFLSPEYGNMFLRIEKVTVAIGLDVLFIIISPVIVFLRNRSLPKR